MPAVAKIDTFSNEDFSLIVANSTSLLEVLRNWDILLIVEIMVLEYEKE